MTSCSFHGFRRVVQAADQCKVVMKDCLVDLTMKGGYGGRGDLMAMPVVSHLVQEYAIFGPLCYPYHVRGFVYMPRFMELGHSP
jgi:hypothetical protein